MNTEQQAIYNKKYYQENKEKIKKAVTEYQKTIPYKPDKRRTYYEKYKDKAKEASKKRYFSISPLERWAKGAVYNHKYAGYVVEFTAERLMEIAMKITKCQICGCDIKPLTQRQPSGLTLDRMNNENVLREDNILLICRSCNNTKGSRTLKEFQEYCKMVSERDFAKFIRDGEWRQ